MSQLETREKMLQVLVPRSYWKIMKPISKFIAVVLAVIATTAVASTSTTPAQAEPHYGELCLANHKLSGQPPAVLCYMKEWALMGSECQCAGPGSEIGHVGSYIHTPE